MRREIVFQGERNHCFGCGADNPQGLRLRFFETEDGVEAPYTVPDHLAGAAGIVHGGVQATLLDEAMCMAAYAKLGTPVVTGEITVRYLKPAPISAPLVARGRIVENLERSVIIEGGIYCGESGEQLTRARGRFFFSTD